MFYFRSLPIAVLSYLFFVLLDYFVLHTGMHHWLLSAVVFVIVVSVIDFFCKKSFLIKVLRIDFFTKGESL
ncbi:unnamed protein product [Fructobacillus tropaeoli]|nr:unnamed protein product [Fructobacillus tropaeoli]